MITVAHFFLNDNQIVETPKELDYNVVNHGEFSIITVKDYDLKKMRKRRKAK